MKVNPLSFFNFCSGHVPLLRQLAEWKGEISEAEARRLIRAQLSPESELPDTTWRRLRELQILVAVQECTSREVLPESYRSMERAAVLARINELRALLNS